VVFIFKKHEFDKSKIHELFGHFFSVLRIGPGPSPWQLISPSLGPSPSIYAQSTQSDCMKQMQQEGKWQVGALLLERA